MSLVLSICILFLLIMQSVNGAQFLDTTSLFIFPGEAAVPVFGTVIVLLTALYAWL